MMDSQLYLIAISMDQGSFKAVKTLSKLEILQHIAEDNNVKKKQQKKHNSFFFK